MEILLGLILFVNLVVFSDVWNCIICGVFFGKNVLYIICIFYKK